MIGNRAKVATHNDPLNNIACNVAGHRRFTLFPPEQIGNLYMGPLHVTPAGTPISMVHLTNPDLERFPRFSDAMESASVAELEPGDALFIPYQWYHHVEALDPLNILIDCSLGTMRPKTAAPPGMRCSTRSWRSASSLSNNAAHGEPISTIMYFSKMAIPASICRNLRAEF